MPAAVSFLGACDIEAGHAFAFVGDAFAAVPAFRVGFPAKVLLLLLCFYHLIRLMNFKADIIVTLWCHDHSSWFNLVIFLLLEACKKTYKASLQRLGSTILLSWPYRSTCLLAAVYCFQFADIHRLSLFNLLFLSDHHC